MKTLICMAIYDTEDNNRSQFTEKSLPSIINTTDPHDDRIVVIDNASCKKTKDIIKRYEKHIDIITLEENIGTAEAINRGIEKFWDGLSTIVKIDNDVVIHDTRWTDRMRRCFDREPKLGILGLKRKDLPNHPEDEQYPTKLLFIEHKKYESWEVIELCEDIIGTCTMYSASLIRKVGYLFQPELYGFDDNLMCIRSLISGFANAFYPFIEIDHIDPGGDWYCEHKKKLANIGHDEVRKIQEEYKSGERSIYYNPFKK